MKRIINHVETYTAIHVLRNSLCSLLYTLNCVTLNNDKLLINIYNNIKLYCIHVYILFYSPSDTKMNRN